MKPGSDEYASTALKNKTEHGKHAHWSTYDLGLEGARFQMLQDIIDADDFDQTSADEILGVLQQFAQSNGYATADSVYYTYGTLELSELGQDINHETRINAEVEIENLENEFREDGYFHEALQSEKTLAQSAKSDAARTFLGLSKTGAGGNRISTLMNEAYTKGVSIYKKQIVKEKTNPAS